MWFTRQLSVFLYVCLSSATSRKCYWTDFRDENYSREKLIKFWKLSATGQTSLHYCAIFGCCNTIEYYNCSWEATDIIFSAHNFIEHTRAVWGRRHVWQIFAFKILYADVCQYNSTEIAPVVAAITILSYQKRFSLTDPLNLSAFSMCLNCILRNILTKQEIWDIISKINRNTFKCFEFSTQILWARKMYRPEEWLLTLSDVRFIWNWTRLEHYGRCLCQPEPQTPTTLKQLSSCLSHRNSVNSGLLSTISALPTTVTRNKCEKNKYAFTYFLF